jgi:hypothetical protein
MVCRDCIPHVGSPERAVGREEQHRLLYVRRCSELTDELAMARSERDQAQRARDEALNELASRPSRTLVRVENLDAFVVQTATTERDEAYRKRESALGALSDIRKLHHKSKGSDACSCGARYDRCEVARIVDRWEPIKAWEKRQAGRAARGYPHGLDRAHPALGDPTWLDQQDYA